MRIPRIFVDASAIDLPSKHVALDDPAVRNQLLNVLRMRDGAYLDILDGRGTIYRCTLIASDRQRCHAVIESSQPAGGEASIKVIVALPVIKSARFEWAIEKLTELGAAEIIAMETERSMRAGDREAKESKLKRWQAIAKEASQQCERALIPDVVAAQPFATTLDLLRQRGDRILIAAERKDARTLLALLANSDRNDTVASLAVLIGPEGGFTEDEFKMAEDAGAEPIALGKRILRSETAAIYAASLITGCLDK
ncbi:MAG TPA: 16S rRNA (uracil(1498)-N(3))-methyltransferase [Planktothrix sp.]|jgi:16S rRNA (uracil1498-N3)-methyltransferase